MVRYIVDQAHTTVGFVVRHAGIGKTRGTFTGFEGVIDIPNIETLEGASTRGTIDATSVDTRSADRDNHLRSADFFDSETYPEMTFVSTSFDGSTLVGDLTIKGITKPVTLDVEFNGVATDPWGNDKAGFEAKGELNRTDWGLTWNAALEKGGVLVSEKITLVIDVELGKQA